MTTMHPVSAGGFSSAAGEYARVRPAYARGSIGLLAESIPDGAVLDVAAGTGILTGQLLRAGRSVVGLEPLEAMVAQFRRALPGVPAVSGLAEALPFAARTFAGVTIAQAFHWMDHARAVVEARRVLEPGGVLALLWNARDERVTWVHELTELIERRSGGRPYSDHREQPWEEIVGGDPALEHLGTHRYANPVASSPDLVVARVLSTSFVAVMDQRSRDALAAEVRSLLEREEATRGRRKFDYPHDTVVYLWRNLGP